MSDQLDEIKQLTRAQLLDAALCLKIPSEEAERSAAFLEALSTLVGQWLLLYSESPEMDAVTVLCKARGCPDINSKPACVGTGHKLEHKMASE